MANQNEEALKPICKFLKKFIKYPKKVFCFILFMCL